MATYDPAFLDLIEALPASDWQGRVWRHMFNDFAPERINTSGARWNPPGVGAIYTSLERETAIAEGEYAIEVQPLRFYRRRVVYELHVEAPDVVDLTTTDSLAAAGLTPTDISADDHAACRNVAGAIAWLGRGGILVPSARHPGHNMVILIGPGGESEIERLGHEVIYDGES